MTRKKGGGRESGVDPAAYPSLIVAANPAAGPPNAGHYDAAANPAVERWTIRERLAISSRDETAAWLQRANARIRELEDRIAGLEAHCCVKTGGGEYWARQGANR